MKRFESYNDYTNWTERFDDCNEYMYIPVAIDDGNKLAMDMFTDCKSYKTALKRFEKTFGKLDEEVKSFIEGIRECCESGSFNESVTDEGNGGYSWGVEQYENTWYVFLNISGVFRG